MPGPPTFWGRKSTIRKSLNWILFTCGVVMTPGIAYAQTCVGAIPLTRVTWVADGSSGFAMHPTTGVSASVGTVASYGPVFGRLAATATSVIGQNDYLIKSWNASAGGQLRLRQVSVCAIYDFQHSLTNNLGASLTPPFEPIEVEAETNSHTGSLSIGAPIPLTESWSLYPTFSAALTVSNSKIENEYFVSGSQFGVLGVSPGVGFVYRDRMALTVNLGWTVKHPEEFETGMVTAIRFSLRLGQK